MRELSKNISLVSTLVREKNSDDLQILLASLHPADVADIIENFNETIRLQIFDLLAPEKASDVLVELNAPAREDILDDLSTEELGEILEEMESDDAADIIQELEPKDAQKLLQHLDKDDREEYSQLIRYDEFSAGGIMQTELVSIQVHETVEEAIEEIRRKSQLGEIDGIYNVYVIDEDERFVGRVPLDKLITAKSGTRVEELIEEDQIFVDVNADQEVVARLFVKYDLISMPVIDDQNLLVGRISVDDILEVMEEEADEDFMRMAGISEDEEEIAEGGTWLNVRRRFPWLFLAWFGGLLISLVVSVFDDTISQIIYLAAFMPIIAGMGGSLGTQSTTIVVRGIATGKIGGRKLKAFIFQEMFTITLLAATFGILLGGAVQVMHAEITNLGLTVGAAIACSMMIAGTLGTTIPLFLHKIGFDPAISTGPFVTTLTDLLAIATYFVLANAFMLSGG
jgi:magnesium transporter